MFYYFFCQFLIISFFGLLFFIFYKKYTEGILTKWNVILALILVIFFKFHWNIPFWGLEYEDAYVFSGVGRMFSLSTFTESFLTDCVTIGSLENPMALSRYGGHFILYSTYLSNFIEILGFSYNTLTLANLIVTFLIILILSLFLGKNSSLWFLAPLLYCFAPIINVFSTTLLSETFSSLIIITYLFYWNEFDNKKEKIYYYLSIFLFFVAIMCKRENLILFIIPCIYSLVGTLNDSKIIRRRFEIIIPYIAVCIFYLVAIQNVFTIESIEAVDIAGKTFSFANFVKLAPYFITSLFTIENFSIVNYLFVISIIFLNRKSFAEVSLLCLFLGYFLLYTAHYRGYFFAKYGEVSIFETFRYLNNFYCIVPLIITIVISSKMKIKAKYLYAVTSILIACNLYSTINMRNEYNQIEQKVRFNSSSIIMNYIKDFEYDNNYILVTDNTLIYQNLYNTDTFLYDITLYNDAYFRKENKSIYLEVDNLPYWRERYNIKIDMKNWKYIMTLSDNKVLYKFIK